MRATHRTTIVAKCPHGETDVYAASFLAGTLVCVEAIQKAIDELTRDPIYQEALTQRLADATGCAVVTVGTHGRFETTCEADPS